MKSSCALLSLPLARSTRSPWWKKLDGREDTRGLASASRLDGDDESGTWGRGKSGRP
jgi:hypothetical protein